MNDYSAVKEYNPNIERCVQTVRLEFRQWDYGVVKEVKVTGNVAGFSVIKGAIYDLYESLPTNEYEEPILEMLNEAWDKLIISGHELEDEDSLEAMLVSATIVSRQPVP